MTAPKHVTLDYRPRDWQRQVHLERRRFSVLALHRRAGKTVLAVMELIEAALRCKRPQGVYVYLAPFLRQAKAIAWGVLKSKVEPLRILGGVEVSEGELSVRFLHNGAVIRLYGADNPDALRGMGLEGVVVDEVAQVKPEVWRDILQPALSDRLGWALFIGTPHGVNLFSELFFAADGKPDWYRGRWTVYETGALDPREVERLRDSSLMSEASFAREYLCDFAAAGDDQLISLTDVENAARRGFPDSDIIHSPRILGVDPARFGDDRSVVIQRQGLIAYEPKAWRQIDNMTLASRISDMWEDWQPHAVFIDAGAGAGVIDRLRQLGRDPIEVAFGGKAMSAKFANRRSEMWATMAEWVRSGAIPNNPDLKQELATPVYWYDAQDRMVLEPKEDIKKRLQGGGSPDLADALALTFAAPVAAPSMRVGSARRIGADHDPLKGF